MGFPGGCPVAFQWPAKNDDGQLLSDASGGSPVLWRTTNTVQVTDPTDDEGLRSHVFRREFSVKRFPSKFFCQVLSVY